MEKGAVNERMLEALRCFLNGMKVTWEDGLSADDWRSFFRLCQCHQILPMVYDTVYRCQAFKSFPQQEMQAQEKQTAVQKPQE